MAPKLQALDRLRSQLLTSGVQDKNMPLFQVIDQLIKLLRENIDSTEAQINSLTPTVNNTGIIITSSGVHFLNDNQSGECQCMPFVGTSILP